MYKILILAYLIGQDPSSTMQTFQLDKEFATMEDCKKELLLKDTEKGTDDVMWEFVNDLDFKYDWLAAGCQNEDASEEFVIEPEYPKGKPKELQGLEVIPGLKV